MNQLRYNRYCSPSLILYNPLKIELCDCSILSHHAHFDQAAPSSICSYYDMLQHNQLHLVLIQLHTFYTT